jgi:uncharacterized YigZ family protein
MIDEYFTIFEKSIFEMKEKGSKFITVASPVSNLNNVENLLKINVKEYYDATHNCYAFRLGFLGNLFRYSDAGEPAGTAGKPILGAIDKHRLTDIIIIVNRYFGGKKLGASGLFSAYFTSAENVLKNSKIITKIITEQITLKVDHNLINLIMRSVSNFNARIIHQNFEEKAKFVIEIRKSRFSEYKEHLINITKAKIDFEAF